jgi:hypothetical protein
MFSVHGRVCVSCNQYISQSRAAAYESLCLICWRKVTKKRRCDLIEKKRKRFLEDNNLVEDRGRMHLGDERFRLETAPSDEECEERLIVDDCPDAIEVFPGDPRPRIYSEDDSIEDCPETIEMAAGDPRHKTIYSEYGDSVDGSGVIEGAAIDLDEEHHIGHFTNTDGRRKQRHSSKDLLYSSRWTDFTNRLDSKYNNRDKGQMDSDGGTDTTVMESDSMGGGWSDVDWENSSCSDGSLYENNDDGSDVCGSDLSDDLKWIDDDKEWDTCFLGDSLVGDTYEEEGGPIGFIRCMNCRREGLPSSVVDPIEQLVVLSRVSVSDLPSLEVLYAERNSER